MSSQLLQEVLIAWLSKDYAQEPGFESCCVTERPKAPQVSVLYKKKKKLCKQPISIWSM